MGIIKPPNNHYYDQSLPINQSLNRSTNFLTNQPTNHHHEVHSRRRCLHGRYHHGQPDPEQVVDANNTFTGGLKGARGVYKFGLNSKENVICYNITVTGFQGEYQSPAISATHVHEAVRGRSRGRWSRLM